MIFTSTLTPIFIHLSSGQQGWKTLPQLAYPILLLTPANQGLQQKGSPFSHWDLADIGAVKAHIYARPTQTRS